MKLQFPTHLHEAVAVAAHRFFAAEPGVDTVLVVNSCARGKAIPESDLDMAILVAPAAANAIPSLEVAWQQHYQSAAIFEDFRRSGPFATLHLDVIDGQYNPSVWDDGGGPDYFEIEIGNRVAHSAPLGAVGPYFQKLQAHWLPYYEESLRNARLAMVREACLRDLEPVPFYVRRELYFQAFDRLYKAFQEFLQALFISRRVYPIAYNKWIREQVEDWLGLPELYPKLTGLLSISNLTSGELAEKAVTLRNLVETWCAP